MFIIEVVNCLWHSLEAASFARLLLKWYHPFFILTYATSLLSHYNILQAGFRASVSVRKGTGRNSVLVRKKKLKYLFNVCSEMGSYILFILAPH